MNKIKMNWFYFVAISLLGFYILIITVALFYYNKKESFHQPNISFLPPQDVALFLKQDRDKYVQQMSTADLYARKCKTVPEYIDKISKCTLVFEPDERKTLVRCAHIADKFLLDYQYNIIHGKDIAKIPWKFALICNEYEEGLPHTREDIIFLSRSNIIGNDENIISTLIHEKVHIYQRYHPHIMKKVMERMGYTKSKSNLKYVLKRSNPDITDIIYVNPHTGREMVFVYRTATPYGITDVYDGSVQSIEHPYEQIAYDIANVYLQQYLKSIVNQL